MKALLTFFGLWFSALVLQGQPADPPLRAFFDQVGLTDQQRATVETGRPVAKVLSWGEASEVYVFGAVPSTARRMSI